MMLPDQFFGFRFRTELGRPPAVGRSATSQTVVTLTVSASPDTVFNFLADIENLPRWATDFCERLEIIGGRWVALTSFGDVFVEYATDGHTWRIELHVGEEPERMNLFVSMQVDEQSDGGSSVVFLLWPMAGVDAARHARHVREFLQDLRGLLVRFGGGWMDVPGSAPEPVEEPMSVPAGLSACAQ